MTTRQRHPDAPTVEDWALGLVVVTFIVIGCPALAEALVSLVMP